LPNNIITPQFGDYDNRPLPERIAALYNFKLAFHDDDGLRLYAVQDWIAGIVPSSNVRNLWSMMKKRRPQLYTRCVQLPYKATDGKKYPKDFADAETLYLITQRMEAHSGNRDAVLEYLAHAGVVLDELVRDPEKAAALFDNLDDDKQYRRLLREGYPPEYAKQWVSVRRRQKETQKHAQSVWTARGVHEGFEYGRLNNDVHKTATGKTATEASRQLNIKGTSRDFNSAADNAAIEIVCSTSAALHDQLDSQGVDELSEDINSVKPMIDAARPELNKLFSQQPRRLPPGKPKSGA
jgi:hypothetical protein